MSLWEYLNIRLMSIGHLQNMYIFFLQISVMQILFAIIQNKKNIHA